MSFDEMCQYYARLLQRSNYVEVAAEGEEGNSNFRDDLLSPNFQDLPNLVSLCVREREIERACV